MLKLRKTITGSICWAVAQSSLIERYFPANAAEIDTNLYAIAAALIPIGLWHQMKKTGITADSVPPNILRKKK